MTKTFFKIGIDGVTTPDFDKMLEYIKETTDLHEPAVEIAFICKVVVLNCPCMHFQLRK